MAGKSGPAGQQKTSSTKSADVPADMSDKARSSQRPGMFCLDFAAAATNQMSSGEAHGNGPSLRQDGGAKAQGNNNAKLDMLLTMMSGLTDRVSKIETSRKRPRDHQMSDSDDSSEADDDHGDSEEEHVTDQEDHDPMQSLGKLITLSALNCKL